MHKDSANREAKTTPSPSRPRRLPGLLIVAALSVSAVQAKDWESFSTSLPGVNGIVSALRVEPRSGKLYVGGTFDRAGDVMVKNIAVWDGLRWSSLGPGLDGTVRCLAVHGDTVYAGGEFHSVGGVPSPVVARWDGRAWTAIGQNLASEFFLMHPTIFSLAFRDGLLFAGGSFDSIDHRSVRNIAAWDGSTWSNLETGTTNSVHCLLASPTGVYAGGSFTFAGDKERKYLAKWDGSTWQDVGAGTSDEVYALAGSDTNLFVGGRFRYAGGGLQFRIAKWDRTAWSSVGGGFVTGFYGDGDVVHSLSLDGRDLYVGGSFGQPGNSRRNIAKWDGTTWSSLGNGIERTAEVVEAHSGTVYVAGGSWEDFSHVAQWNSDGWKTLGGGFDRMIYRVASSSRGLVAGGYLVPGETGIRRHVAVWNGSRWDTLGGGLFGQIYSILEHQGRIYVGGAFDSIGGTRARNIAYWEGSSWHALGTGVNNAVWVLLAEEGTLFAAGWFDSAGGQSARRIAQWSETGWQSLGDGLPGSINALAMYQGSLIAGSSLTNPREFLMRWNGTTWSALDTSMFIHSSPGIRDMATRGDTLLVGGAFQRIGNVPANNIARWDGQRWSAMGDGLLGNVNSLVWKDGLLAAGGTFDSTAGSPLKRVAVWENGRWRQVGSGLDAEVLSLAADETTLFAGGRFLTCPDGPCAGLTGYRFAEPITTTLRRPHRTLQATWNRGILRISGVSEEAFLLDRNGARLQSIPHVGNSTATQAFRPPSGVYFVRSGNEAAPFLVP